MQQVKVIHERRKRLNAELSAAEGKYAFVTLGREERNLSEDIEMLRARIAELDWVLSSKKQS